MIPKIMQKSRRDLATGKHGKDGLNKTLIASKPRKKTEKLRFTAKRSRKKPRKAMEYKHKNTQKHR